MKKIDRKPSPKQTKERRYFNPYDRNSEGVNEHTYNKRVSTSQKVKKKSTSSTKKVSGNSKKKVASKGTSKNNVQQLKHKKSAGQGIKISKKPQGTNNGQRQMTRPHVAKPRKLSKKQKLRLKRRRQIYLMMRLVGVMGTTLAVILGAFWIKDYFTKTSISTQLVQTGSLDTSASLEGIILRNEKVVYGTETGDIQYVVAEGEKVKKDGTVYVLANESKVNETTSEIADVEEEIYNKAEDSAAIATNQNEKYNLDQEVKNNFEEYYINCFEDSTSYIYALRSKLDSNVSNRTNLYVAQQEGKDDELVSKKLQLDKVLENYQKGKAADESGVISFNMDGYETNNVEEYLKTLTYSEYNKIRKVTTTNQLGQNTIEANAPIYKLVLNNTWYIVSYISEKEDQYVQGNTYELYLDNSGDKPITFTLASKQDAEGKIRLVFKTSDQISSFLANRSISFSIGDKDVSGLKIPTSAIVEQNFIKIPMAYTVKQDETTGVYRKNGEKMEFIAIDIHSKDEEAKCYYVLQDLTKSGQVKINDVLINETDNTTYQVTESIVKQGVYVVNGQVAHFKQIEILDQSNEYAIVRHNNNSQLKEMDKIISNPKSVKMDQLLDQMKIENE